MKALTPAGANSKPKRLSAQGPYDNGQLGAGHKMQDCWRDRHPELAPYRPHGKRTVRMHPHGRQIAQYASDPAFRAWWLDRHGQPVTCATLEQFFAAGFTAESQWARVTQETAA